MADCPATTNAVSAGAAAGSGGSPQVTAAGTGSTMPMAPVGAPVARASDTARPMTAIPAATPADAPVESEWLAAATAESLDFDVALALGLGDPDLAGSV